MNLSMLAPYLLNQMITGFELETAPLPAVEKKMMRLVAHGLSNHIGRSQAITGREICGKLVGAGFGKITEPRLRKITNFLRSAKILPVMAMNTGYYVSYEKADIEKQIKSLEDRRDAIQCAINGLKQWV